jgi:hypothetical protein
MSSLAKEKGRIYVMYSARQFSLILTKFGFSRQTFVKAPNIQFYENLFSGSRADIGGRTNGQADGRTDMMKLIGASRDLYERASKILNLDLESAYQNQL